MTLSQLKRAYADLARPTAIYAMQAAILACVVAVFTVHDLLGVAAVVTALGVVLTGLVWGRVVDNVAQTKAQAEVEKARAATGGAQP